MSSKNSSLKTFDLEFEDSKDIIKSILYSDYIKDIENGEVDIDGELLDSSEDNKRLNKIYDPERWEEVNPINKDIGKAYLKDARVRRLRASSIEQYAGDIRIIFIYIMLYCKNKDIRKLTKKDVKDFMFWLSETQKVSNARVNRLLSTLRGILDFLEDNEEYKYPYNVAARIKGLPREPVREIVFVEDRIALMLVNELIKREEYQKALLISFLYDTGARKSEAAQVQKYSFMDSKKSITNMLIAKRGKKYRAVYHSLTKKCAKLWLEQRGEDDCPALFINKDKLPADPELLYRWVVECRSVLKEITGIKLNFNCHSFRHSMIQNLSDGSHYLCREKKLGSLTLDKIKLIVNHSNISITESYKRPEGEREICELFGIKYEDG